MLITSILLLLLSNAVNLRRDKSILYSREAIIIMLYCIIIGINGLDLSLLNNGLAVYSGLFSITTLGLSFHIFIYLISLMILTLTAFYPRKIITQLSASGLVSGSYTKNVNILNLTASQYSITEYPLIILFIISGANFLISSSDIVSLFLSIELQSYGLYLLCTLYRNSESATSAGLTYFLLGGLSSCLILLGSSVLYINYGTTNIEMYYIINSIANTELINVDKPLYLSLGLVIMSVGLLFKISAAPFHFWSPDVYDAIPTIVTTFVAIISKLSILILFIQIIKYNSTFTTADTTFYSKTNTLTISILISSLLSLLIGTILGLTQYRIKRLFAYSTISHLGFILLALCIGSLESCQAYIFYIMQYTITNLNAFVIIIAAGYSLYGYYNSGTYQEKYEMLLDKNNSPIQYINQLKGFYKINPMLSVSFAVTLFSFVGIPPLVGFFGKQMVLSAALDQGYIFLVLVAILTSIISAAYYLNIIKQIFFDSCDYLVIPSLKTSQTSNKDSIDTTTTTTTVDTTISTHSIQNINTNNNNTGINISNIMLSNSISILISILTLILTLFIFNSEIWLSLVQILALITINT